MADFVYRHVYLYTGVEVARWPSFLKIFTGKSLKLAQVLRMTVEEARAIFRKIRWAETDSEPVCPACGCCASYPMQIQRRWKCKGCTKQEIFAI
jgi:hypothetical protein